MKPVSRVLLFGNIYTYTPSCTKQIFRHFPVLPSFQHLGPGQLWVFRSCWGAMTPGKSWHKRKSVEWNSNLHLNKSPKVMAGESGDSYFMSLHESWKSKLYQYTSSSTYSGLKLLKNQQPRKKASFCVIFSIISWLDMDVLLLNGWMEHAQDHDLLAFCAIAWGLVFTSV